MKYCLIILMLSSFALAAKADNLRSETVRSLICNEIIDQMDLDGIEIENDMDWIDPIILIEDLDSKCASATSSFKVVNQSYNQRARKVSDIEIEVSLNIPNDLNVSGKVEVKRSLFNPNTGEVQVGNWKIVKNKMSYSLGSSAIEKMAEVISAGVERAEGWVSDYSTSRFSERNELRDLNREINSDNEDSGCQMTEASTYSLRSRENIFDYFELESTANGSEYLDYLIKNKMVKSVIYTESSEWEESCAYYRIYIYLKNGKKISISFDFTT